MIWYVNPKTGSDTADGRSMPTAFKNLPHAIGAASAGDTILLAPGPYGQDLPQLVSAARVAKLNVAVVGSD
jgi:hypothetical protein